MICSNCGNELEDGAMFCTKCGMKLVNASTMPAVPNMVQMSGMDGNPGEADGTKKIKMPEKPDFSKLPKFEEIIKDKKKMLMAAVPAGAVLLLLIILLVVKIAGGGDKGKIDTFAGYKWGTSYDKVFANAVTEGMEENDDYSEYGIGDGEDTKILRIRRGTVGGCETIVFFMFYKDKLVAGDYSLYHRDDIDLLIPKYEEIYGEPLIATTNGDERLFIWKDKNKNYIVQTEEFFLYAVYKEEIFDLMPDLDEFGVDLRNPEKTNLQDNNLDGI